MVRILLRDGAPFEFVRTREAEFQLAIDALCAVHRGGEDCDIEDGC